jgi:hypothetical protein
MSNFHAAGTSADVVTMPTPQLNPQLTYTQPNMTKSQGRAPPESAALLHSASDQAIGPKTEDRDDTDLGDQLQVLSFLFIHRSPSSFACVHSFHITFRLLFWRLVCNFIDVCIRHYCYQ